MVVRTFENIEEMARELKITIQHARDYLNKGHKRNKRYVYEYQIINTWEN